MPLYGKGFDTLNHTQFMNIKTLEQTFKSHHIKGNYDRKMSFKILFIWLYISLQQLLLDIMCWGDVF